MNVIHLLTGIAIAKSKENQYHVTDTKSLQNTAFLSGLLPNPLIGYLLIDQKAKQLATTPAESNSNTIPVVIPPTSTEEEIKNFKEIIVKEVYEEITKIIDPYFLVSNDPVIRERTGKIQACSAEYLKLSEIEKLETLRLELDYISKSKYIKGLKGLTDEEINSFKKIEQLIKENDLINESIMLLKGLNGSEPSAIYLSVLFSNISPVINKLYRKIQKSEIQPDDASSGPKKA